MGRSKSRRHGTNTAGATTHANNQSNMYNVRTIEEYSSGIVDGTFNRYMPS